MPLFAFRSYATLTLLAALALPAVAAPETPATPSAPATATAAGFKAVVTAETAIILAGSSKAYYPVGRLPRGAVVEVLDASYPGYVQINPPAGCEAFVAKAKVQTDDKGAVGTVSEDGTECFAAGMELTPAKSFRVQRKLSKGETLEIIAVVGDFYRVKAPRGTTVYMSADAVRKATETDLGAGGPPEAKPDFKADSTSNDGKKNDGPQTVKPAVKKPAEPGEKKPDAGKTPGKNTEKTPQPPADTLDSVATDPALRAAEGRLLAAYAAAKDAALPSATAKLLLAEYAALAQRTDFDAVDGQLANGRVAQLTRQFKLSEASEKVNAAEKAAIEAGKPPVTPAPVGYDAVGQLKISTVYSGNGLPALYRLADPATDHTIAYVIPSSLDNAGQLLNKLVGIQGEIQVDPTLKLRVIRIKKIEMLSAEGKPAGEPAQAPAPAAETKPAVEAKPAADGKPAEPAGEPAQAPAPVVETKPAVEAKPAADGKPAEPAGEPVQAPAPVVETKPAVEVKPAVDGKPAEPAKIDAPASADAK